jgi:hypothetical protein
MQSTDFERFHVLLLGMGELYTKEISRPLLDAYWVALRDWDLEAFEAACAHLMQHQTFMPRPSEFTALRKAGRETAGEVFAGIRQWLKYTPNGYMLDPKTPRIIASAIRAIGGANAYAMCDEEKLPFLERRFCEHYDQISGADDTRKALPAIAQDEGARTRALEQAWNFKTNPRLLEDEPT